MRKLKAYSLYDRKAEHFVSFPEGVMNDEVAIRKLRGLYENPDTIINKHPEDYALYCVGEFDMITGKLEGFELNTLVFDCLYLTRKEGIEDENAG